MRFVLPLLLMQSFALGEECVPIELLGTSGDEIKERFNYSVQMSEDDEACTYSLKVSFKHDEEQPIPDDPSVQCNAMAGPPAVDSNGIPYLKHRSWYISFEDDIKEATGFDHVDLSFNPCGHPPLGAFTIPHYDLHFYRMTPYERTCMTCVLDLPSPACDVSPGTQTSDSGRAYFNVKKVFGTDDYSNMPKGFVVDDSAFVMMMGGHAWQGDQTPSPDNPWINPIYILGTYDGNINFVEPMIPLTWMAGNESHGFTEEYQYEGQTIKELPSSLVVDYDADTGMVTVLFIGPKATSCSDSDSALMEEVSGSLRSSKSQKQKGKKNSKKSWD